MDSPSSNRSAPLLLGLVAILAIALIAAVAWWAAFAPVAGGGTQAEALSPESPQKANPPATTAITEDEAHRLVWALPEVQTRAEQLRERGSRPLTLTISRPEPSSTPGTQEAAFFIRLSEDRGDHIAAVETFAVDAYSREISIYDVAEGRRISLEEWRGRR